MKIIALGSNLPGPTGGAPKENLQHALEMLPDRGIRVVAVSPFYASEPVPPSGQAWYVNAAALIETDLGPEEVLSALLAVEADMGRVRVDKNEPRIIDLDLIDFDGIVLPSKKEWQTALETGETKNFYLPHLRAHQRRFVLEPLLDIAPDWRHPVLGASGAALASDLGIGERIARLET